jgi:hypothetical protein
MPASRLPHAPHSHSVAQQDPSLRPNPVPLVNGGLIRHVAQFRIPIDRRPFWLCLAAFQSSGIGSCGAPRPCLAAYVMETGPHGGDRRRRGLVLATLCWSPGPSWWPGTIRGHAPYAGEATPGALSRLEALRDAQLLLRSGTGSASRPPGRRG